MAEVPPINAPEKQINVTIPNVIGTSIITLKYANPADNYTKIGGINIIEQIAYTKIVITLILYG